MKVLSEWTVWVSLILLLVEQFRVHNFVKLVYDFGACIEPQFFLALLRCVVSSVRPVENVIGQVDLFKVAFDGVLITGLNQNFLAALHFFPHFVVFFLLCNNVDFAFELQTFASFFDFLHIVFLELAKLLLEHDLVVSLLNEIFHCLLGLLEFFTDFPVSLVQKGIFFFQLVGSTGFGFFLVISEVHPKVKGVLILGSHTGIQLLLLGLKRLDPVFQGLGLPIPC